MRQKVQEFVKIEQTFDKDGNLVNEKESRTTKRIDRVTEPKYIKLYTKTWCDLSLNEIPVGYRPLFLELASRMSYYEGDDLLRRG